MKDLREIIVNATSEMLDEPDQNGLYKTTRFYNRLEKEVEEYIASMPTDQNFHKLMLQTVKNSEHVTPRLQNVIAQYLEFQSKPPVIASSVKLNEKEE